ncbi:MAG TPA: hypothetical protein VJ743_06660, partial [Albitalea sp.]|nr:hypothetical protein [Albitalea sp.]
MSAMPEAFTGQAANDTDSQETREWLDALSAVIGAEGGERAHFLLEQLIDHARQAGIDVPFSANTAYVNTIPTEQEERCPGNVEVEERLRAYMRWNAMAMVVRANRIHPETRERLARWRQEMPRSEHFPQYLFGLPHVETQLHYPVLDGLGLLDPAVAKAEMAARPDVRAFARKTVDSLTREYKQA